MLTALIGDHIFINLYRLNLILEAVHKCVAKAFDKFVV